MDTKDLLQKLVEILLEVKETQSVQAKTLDVNTQSLVEHVARTNALEERQDRFEELVAKEIGIFNRHLAFVKGAVWSVGIVVAALVVGKQLGLFETLFG